MGERARLRILTAGVILWAGTVFSLGINWGLPSREIDPILFGPGGTRLAGAEIERLAGRWDDDPTRPADVAANPITDRAQPITLIAPDSDAVNRARIIERYRLYSAQPDEMITFRALAGMHPGRMQLDPRLYQYGGLWIYPVGAIIKFASLFGYVRITDDQAFYLDSPEEFAKFYILARGYSALWGIVATLTVLALVRRAAGGLLLPAIAAICFAALPLVVEMGHEAKPHLAGVALLLLAIVAASKYVETAKWKWIVWTAIACGAAAGMVLSGAIGLVILPAMAFLRRDKLNRFVAVCCVGAAIAAGVYFATNPYVAIDLLLASHREVLRANLANTHAMYAVGPFAGAIWNSIRLIAIGTSWPVAILGVIGAVALLLAGRRQQNQSGVAALLASVAAVNLVQFTIFAANKPGEYARFALFFDVALMLAAFLALARFVRSAIAGFGLVLLAATYSANYEKAIALDDSRTQAARQIDLEFDRLSSPLGPAPTLYVSAEPAPYCLPPVNLFGWRIVLLGRDGRIPANSPAGILVTPDGSLDVLKIGSAPISWADKPFLVTEIGGR